MDQATVGAFSVFYAANYALILNATRRRLDQLASAEDVTAEVFRIAWQHHLKGGELAVPWLYGVMRNVVGREYRRAGRATRLVERIAGSAPAAPGLGDRDTAMRDALLRLKASDRELLFMNYWEELTGAEIAEILGASVSTVWMRLSRARAALRRELERADSDAFDLDEGVYADGRA